MHKPVFISGIGTDVGKTLVAAVVTEALGADYWKPIQAGISTGTDPQTIASLVSNAHTVIHPEAYRLAMPASPHIAAAAEGITIEESYIQSCYRHIRSGPEQKTLVIEGAGGLLVPIDDQGRTVADMVQWLGAGLILVSRNYLGSINHSLLTAYYCRQHAIPVLGWVFSDQYLNYESQIVQWTGYPSLGSIPHLENINASVIQSLANTMRPALEKALQ